MRISFDKNGSGFDILVINPKNKKYALIQIKLRLDALHFSNTRRHSQKNIGIQSESGHTAYAITEADIVTIIKPDEDIPDDLNPYPLSKLMFLSFFMKDLEKKSTPGYCVTTITKSLIQQSGYSLEYTLSKHLELE